MSEIDLSLEPIQKLLRFWLRFMLFGFRIISACFVLALLALAVYDRINPWPEALSALSQHRQQFRICVGAGSDFEQNMEGRTSRVSRSYILIPMAFTSPSVFDVVSTNEAPPIVEQNQAGFWIILIGYSLFLLIFIYQIRSYRHSRKANAMQSPGNRVPSP